MLGSELPLRAPEAAPPNAEQFILLLSGVQLSAANNTVIECDGESESVRDPDTVRDCDMDKVALIVELGVGISDEVPESLGNALTVPVELAESCVGDDVKLTGPVRDGVRVVENVRLDEGESVDEGVLLVVPEPVAERVLVLLGVTEIDALIVSVADCDAVPLVDGESVLLQLDVPVSEALTVGDGVDELLPLSEAVRLAVADSELVWLAVAAADALLLRLPEELGEDDWLGDCN